MSDDVLELTITEYESTTEAEFSGDVWELTIETGQRGPVGIGGEEITHGDLPGRNLPDQHPASAIDVDGTPLDTVLDNVPLLDAANIFTAKQSIDVVVPVTPIADIATTKPTILAHLHGGAGAIVDHFAITLDIGGGVIFKTSGTLAAVVGTDDQPTDEWVATSIGPTGPAILSVTSSDPGELPFIGDLLTSTPKPLVVGTGTDPSHAVTKAQLDASSGAVESVNGETGVVVLDQDDIGSGTTNKAYTATEQTKLAGIASGATANSSDATLLARANHTGTQLASTISDLTALATAVLATASSDTAVTSSTTLTNDTGLSVAITAATWHFRAVLWVTGDSGGDLDTAVTVPTNSAFFVGTRAISNAASGFPNAPIDNVVTSSGARMTGFGTITSNTTMVTIEGTVIATASGNIQIQHSQRNSNATATTVKAGSHIMAWRG